MHLGGGHDGRNDRKFSNAIDGCRPCDMPVCDRDGHFGVGQLYGSICPFVVDLKFVDLMGEKTLRGARGDISCKGDMQKQRREGNEKQQIVHGWGV